MRIGTGIVQGFLKWTRIPASVSTDKRLSHSPLYKVNREPHWKIRIILGSTGELGSESNLPT
jgi:hypothetical protein